MCLHIARRPAAVCALRIGRHAGRIGAADSPRTKKPLSLIPETGAFAKGLNQAFSAKANYFTDLRGFWTWH